jgi:DDE superfamily endonuclease
MTSSHRTPAPCQWFARLAAALDRRSAPRLALLFLGAVLARGRRTVTTWIRAAKLSDQFRPCYTAVAAAGKRADRIARRLLTEVVRPLLKGATRLTLALDDTPTKRYGPHVQGAGIHYNPAPGPAGSPTSTATSSSSWPCSSPTRRGESSPCRCWPDSTSARRTCRASTRSIGRRSAPSWGWPSSCSGGPGPGWGSWACRSGWWPTGPMPRRTSSSRRRPWV